MHVYSVTLMILPCFFFLNKVYRIVSYRSTGYIAEGEGQWFNICYHSNNSFNRFLLFRKNHAYLWLLIVIFVFVPVLLQLFFIS